MSLYYTFGYCQPSNNKNYLFTLHTYIFNLSRFYLNSESLLRFSHIVFALSKLSTDTPRFSSWFFTFSFSFGFGFIFTDNERERGTTIYTQKEWRIKQHFCAARLYGAGDNLGKWDGFGMNHAPGAGSKLSSLVIFFHMKQWKHQHNFLSLETNI